MPPPPSAGARGLHVVARCEAGDLNAAVGRAESQRENLRGLPGAQLVAVLDATDPHGPGRQKFGHPLDRLPAVLRQRTRRVFGLTLRGSVLDEIKAPWRAPKEAPR